MIRRLALAIVRRYPEAWRERYEAEVSALVEDSPVRLRDLGEFLRGLITERARELVSADDQPKRTAAVLVWMPLVFIVVFTAIAWGTGLVLRGFTSPWSEARQDTVAIIIASLWLAFVVVRLGLLIRQRGPRWKRVLPAWFGGLLLPVLFVTIACAAWGNLLAASPSTLGRSFDWVQLGIRTYFYVWVLSDLTSSLWPGREMLGEFGNLAVADGWVKVNQAWVQSCHEWIAKGVPSPLADAEAQVDHWTRVRDAARERLRELGYRARFRRESGRKA